MKLTQSAVDSLLLPPGSSDHVVWDDDIAGLGVRLRPSGKTWFYRYRIGARQPRITLGATSVVTAQQARKTAAQLYARVKLGEDPAADRADARSLASETFERAARQYLDEQRASWRPGSFANVERHLLRHAQALHRLELSKAADRRTLATLLTRIASTSGPVEANNMHGSLMKFYRWADGKGLLGDNVSNPLLNVPKAPTNGPRSHVPTDEEVAKIWHACSGDDFGDLVKLLVLTAARRGEISDLRWDEVVADDLIRIPGKRIKNGKERAIPLSEAAQRILRSRHRGGRPLVFGRGDGGFSGWSRAKRELDARAGVSGWTLHDLRRYAATAMTDEKLAPPHIVEACLGHVVGSVVARTYNWAAYLEETRAALDLWAQRIEALTTGAKAPATIVGFRRRKTS
jgi:integrase